LPKKVARSEDTVEEAVEEAVEETVEEVEEAVEETGENPLETEKRRGLCGAATYTKEWSTRWSFITMGTTSSFYWCSVCRQENSCAHQGVRDISRHVEGKGHRAKEQPLNSVSSIAQFYVPETSVGGVSVQEAKTRRAEVKVAVAMVQHNVPFAVADHFSPLYKESFRDSPTAQGFKSTSTKTTCIINEAVAPHFKKELVMKMRENPFTLCSVHLPELHILPSEELHGCLPPGLQGVLDRLDCIKCWYIHVATPLVNYFIHQTKRRLNPWSVKDGEATFNHRTQGGVLIWLVKDMTPPLNDALSLLETGDGQVNIEPHKFSLDVLVCWQEVPQHTTQPAKKWMRI
ncbi:hypothetical protein F7725_012017, partial [Dissostichus mawsoni]